MTTRPTPYQLKAFPSIPNSALDQGMTLRDWFAGMALAEVPDPINESDAPSTARLAYAIADAMLKERNRTPST